MNYILFDDSTRDNFLPLVFMRPMADMRFGILTFREKWEYMLKTKTSTLTESYLSKKFPIVKEETNILINGTVAPSRELIDEIHKLDSNQALIYNECIIAMNLSGQDLEKGASRDAGRIEEFNLNMDLLIINNSWDLFALNKKAIEHDFAMLTGGRKSQTISPSNNVTGIDKIFLEEGARVEFATLNASNGPIYIGKDAEIMEGSMIRGPLAMNEHSVTKMGAKIYGPTTLGPHVKVGGEVNNCVFFGYSNKAHDGFLGNSVIAEWCNLGADTNNSNLKNTYDDVKLWSYKDKTFVNTGLQFCGLIMGDHSKCGINTMFNTGTVVGVNANIFGAGFQRNFISSFSWGGTSGFKPYRLEKAYQVAEAVYERRHKDFDDIEKEIMRAVYDMTIANKQI
ncbi:MAG: GlmU family protein [Bacteroidales bacterium]|nr:GlmU family protein [Bacteroidales bacterium]